MKILTGDLCPVNNLKPLIQFVQRTHFKMENIQMAINFVSPGDYMISLDLKDAYFSVPIAILFVETKDVSLPAYIFAKNV